MHEMKKYDKCPSQLLSILLDGGLVGKRDDGLRCVVFYGYGVRLARSRLHSSERGNGLTLLLRLTTDLRVLLDTVKELLAALRVTDVLDTDVNTLLHVAVAHDLVDDDSDGVGGDVVDDACPTVVVFVGHTPLLRSISLDIDDITNAEGDQVRRHLDHAGLLEAALEHMARTRPVTK